MTNADKNLRPQTSAWRKRRGKARWLNKKANARKVFTKTKDARRIERQFDRLGGEA
jgi:hypothetical protein